MSDRILNVAHIGNGKSTNRYHMPYIMSRPDKFREYKIWEYQSGNSSWAYQDGIEYTGDLESILSDPAVDLVVVNTPVDHYGYVKMALEHGKNVIGEKPFTDTLEQAEELFALAREKGVFLSAYQNRRFDSDFMTVKAVIESGVIGDVFEIVEHFDYWRPEFPPSIHPTGVGQSMTYWHAVHTVDQAISLFGTPARETYDVGQTLGSRAFNDRFDVDLFYDAAPGIAAGGLKYSVCASYFRARQRPSFEVYGTKGCFIKEKMDRQEEHLKLFYLPTEHADFGLDRPEDYGTVYYYDEAGVYHEEKVPTVRGDYAYFYDNVYDVIVNGAEQEVRHEQTHEVIRIIETAIGNLENYGHWDER